MRHAVLTSTDSRKAEALNSLTRHWPEYLIEAAGLGFFMISACLFGTLIEHPSSPIRQAMVDSMQRRVLMGIAMGSTAIGIVYSPWGKQSGAHINPSVTLTFFRLGKIKAPDAAFYIAAQFSGAILGVITAGFLLGDLLRDPGVNYVATLPGKYGVGVAFLGELMISFVLMAVVLYVSNRPSLHRFTGMCAGFLVASFITFEAPISGMSMNPARTFGSAFVGDIWTALWLYFVAPVIGMHLAATCYLKIKGPASVRYAKLHHENSKRCIFCGKPADQIRSLETLLTQQLP